MEPTMTEGKTLMYNEAAQQVGDLGAGPFERFDETPKFKRRENLNSPLKSTNNASQAKDGRQLSSRKDRRKSSEKGFHSGKYFC